MSQGSPLQQPTSSEAVYSLSGVYLDAYNAVVNAQRKLGVNVYALRRWAPQMGGTGFCLLIALQQQTFKDKAGRCIVSRGILAKEAGIGEGTVHRYLHGNEYTSSGLCYWVRQKPNKHKWSKEVHRAVQSIAEYDILLDAPLIQNDQRGLAQFLIEQCKNEVTADKVASALQTFISSTEKLSSVLGTLDEHATRFTTTSNWSGFLPTVVDVVAALGVKVRNGHSTELMDLCSQAQNHIVRWDLVWQKYFYEKWLPVLGPTLTLAILQLRSYCYVSDSGDEARDTFEMRVSDLAAQCGCTGERLRELLKTPNALKFATETVRGTKHKPSTFKVRLRVPIVDTDQALYEAYLNGVGIVDTNGQLGLPVVTSNFGQLIPSVSGRISDSSGNVTSNSGQLGDFLGRVLDSSGGITSNFGQLARSVTSNFGQDINTILNTTPRITLQQQQHAEGDLAAAAGGLLDTFGIVQPFKGRILRVKPDVINIRAWMLYAVTQSGFTEQNGVQKYVTKRLLADEEAPPARFVRWAKLTLDEWRALWRASRGDRSGLTPDLDALTAEWIADWGKMFPNGPFGDDDPNAVAARLWQARGDQPVDRKQTSDDEPAALSTEEAIARGLAIPAGDGKTLGIEQVWRQVLGELQLQLTGATYNTWLGRTSAITFQDGALVIGVHNGYAKDWLENRLVSMVKRTLASIVGRSIEVRFVVWSKDLDADGKPESLEVKAEEEPSLVQHEPVR